MREIVLATETTGLDPLGGHRIIEIGAVELVNHSPTGRTFHRYVCPQRAVPADAVAVHWLTAEFLADKPPFEYVADEFLAFVGNAPPVAHNAGFDIAFLNAELKRAAKPPIATERVVDTLVLARRKHPGGYNTLDDVCMRDFDARAYFFPARTPSARRACRRLFDQQRVPTNNRRTDATVLSETLAGVLSGARVVIDGLGIKQRHTDTFTYPLVYAFWGNQGPSIS